MNPDPDVQSSKQPSCGRHSMLWEGLDCFFPSLSYILATFSSFQHHTHAKLLQTLHLLSIIVLLHLLSLILVNFFLSVVPPGYNLCSLSKSRRFCFFFISCLRIMFLFLMIIISFNSASSGLIMWLIILYLEYKIHRLGTASGFVYHYIHIA